MLSNLLKSKFSSEKLVVKGRDIFLYSKNRIELKKQVEAFLKNQKIAFTSVFKKSKSSSIDVLTVGNEDIIFKPIIAKGAGGVEFEKQLEIDLNNFFLGAEKNELSHPDVITELEKVLDLQPDSGWKVDPQGSKNQKRTLTFNGGKISISNSSGSTVTDITLIKPGKTIYLSLKKSPTYYTLSASIGKYFSESSSKKQINEFFGFDGKLMEGFGKEYFVETAAPKYAKISQNLEDVLAQSVGTNVVLVHKKQPNDVLVSKIGSTNRVNVTDLSADSYSYPEANVRKYANIKVKATINNHSYIVNFQFRGTTAADKGPKYLRILLERL